MTRNQVKRQLEKAQEYVSKRRMSADKAWRGVQEVAAFLVSAPRGTDVKHLMTERYKADIGWGATYIYGEKRESGGVVIKVRRDEEGFGSRESIVHTPDGYKVAGPEVHASSGVTDDLTSTRVVRND